jgi:hypothetical protein
MEYSAEEDSVNFNKEYADILDLIMAHNYSKFSRLLLLNNRFITGVDKDGFSLMYYAVQSLPTKERNEDAIKIIKGLVVTYKARGMDPMFLGNSGTVTDLITMSNNHPILKQLVTEGVFKRAGGKRRKTKRSKRKARKTYRK